jgi:uncharacterized membrane protein
MIVATLALIGIGVATYLALHRLGVIGELVCRIGSCETVQTSRWATFLGVPVAFWGVGFYVALFVVAMATTRPALDDSLGASVALVALTVSGVLFSFWLTYLELFVIHAICAWCVGSAVVVTLACVVALLDWRERKDSSDVA